MRGFDILVQELKRLGILRPVDQDFVGCAIAAKQTIKRPRDSPEPEPEPEPIEQESRIATEDELTLDCFPPPPGEEAFNSEPFPPPTKKQEVSSSITPLDSKDWQREFPNWNP
jgi:hypothetical protein